MPKVTFIEYDTSEHEVDIEVGLSLMEGALDSNVLLLLNVEDAVAVVLATA